MKKVIKEIVTKYKYEMNEIAHLRVLNCDMNWNECNGMMLKQRYISLHKWIWIENEILLHDCMFLLLFIVHVDCLKHDITTFTNEMWVTLEIYPNLSLI